MSKSEKVTKNKYIIIKKIYIELKQIYYRSVRVAEAPAAKIKAEKRVLDLIKIKEKKKNMI